MTDCLLRVWLQVANAGHDEIVEGETPCLVAVKTRVSLPLNARCILSLGLHFCSELNGRPSLDK